MYSSEIEPSLALQTNGNSEIRSKNVYFRLSLKYEITTKSYRLNFEFGLLIHYNHNKDFYTLQNKLYPNWEKWKEKLEQILA